MLHMIKILISEGISVKSGNSRFNFALLKDKTSFASNSIEANEYVVYLYIKSHNLRKSDNSLLCK